MTAEELQAENDSLKVELANARLRADLASLSTTPQTSMPSLNAPAERTRIVESVVNVGMTTPKNMTSVMLHHEVYRNEKIAPTRRQDMGADASQVFRGRQP